MICRGNCVRQKLSPQRHIQNKPTKFEYLSFPINPSNIDNFSFYLEDTKSIRCIYIVPNTSVITWLSYYYVTTWNPLKQILFCKWSTSLIKNSAVSFFLTWTNVQYVNIEWLSVVRVSNNVSLIFLSLKSSLCPVSFNSSQSIFESWVICIMGIPKARSTIE